MKHLVDLKRRGLVVLVSVTSLLAFAGLAWAASVTFMTGGGVWTKVSGLEHAFTREWSPNSGREGIRGFTFYEKSDDPCAIDLLMRKLCSRNCEQKETQRIEFEHEGVGFPPFKVDMWTVKASEDRFVTSVQVCFNGKDDATKMKIKGLRVWEASIDETGKLTYYEKEREEQLNNCTDWKNKVSCPDGKVAVGARAYYATAKTGFAGLALYCAAPKIVVP